MSRTPLFGIWVLLAVSSFGCFSPEERSDDQSIIRAEQFLSANPTPVTRDFLGQSLRHEVLVGVIDSGVDYNHPDLLPHIHFEVSDQGEALRTGWDFVGNDGWPAPYIARTAGYDPQATAGERASSDFGLSTIRGLIQAEPLLARFLDPARNVIQEFLAGIEHGTHVAGLVRSDRPEIGILPYRVIPTRGGTSREDDLETRLVLITQAVHQAVRDGARVVNMSLAFIFERATVKLGEKHFALISDFKAAIASYPEILFVAAAGNDGIALTPETHVTLPCGIELENVLCVGSLDASSEVSVFSNLPAPALNSVFIGGEQLSSSIPNDHCRADSMMIGMVQSELDLIASGESDFRWIAGELLRRCEGQQARAVLSGTSMATPRVARLAAEMLLRKPGLAARDLVRELQAKATQAHHRGRLIFKL